MVVILFGPGDTFDGYRIVRVLAPEGEIQRYLASTEAGEQVILHCRVKRRASDGEVAEFEARVRELQGFGHEHAPRFERAGYAKGSFFWLAVTAPSGKSLREILDETRAPFEVQDVLLLADQVAVVLDAALDRSIAHFGLTPAHIYVDPESLELTSIGSLGVRAVLDAPPAHRRDEVIYRAPEQLRRERADHRADIHAFGIVLYELLAAEPPYVDQLRDIGVPSIASASDLLLDSMMVANPTRLSKRVNGLEPLLDKLVSVMINKRQEDRPATWKDIRAGVTTVGKAFAISLALRGSEEREYMKRTLDESGSLSFDALLMACALRPGEVGLPPGSSSGAAEVASSSASPPEGDAPAAEVAPTTAQRKDDAPAVEVASPVEPVKAGRTASLSGPSSNEAEPGREPSSISRRAERSPWSHRVAPVLLFVGGMAAAASILLWFLHPAQTGPAPAPVIVQAPPPPPPPVRDPSLSPLYLVPLPSEPRAQRLPLSLAPAPQPSPEPSASPPSANEVGRPEPSGVTPLSSVWMPPP